MKRFIYFIVIAMMAFSLTCHPAIAQSNDPVITITQVDTSQFPKVTVYISVKDASGLPLPIDPAKIVIKENGVPVKAENVLGSGSVASLTTLLVMDISGSMATEGKLEGSKAAALNFIDRMRAGDQTGILVFNIVADLIAPITDDQDALRSTIEKIQAEENTAMYDALAQAESILAPYSGRKAIIALTDGLDNRSRSTPEDVIGGITPGGLSISIIGLGDPNLGVNDVTGLDQPTLENLAVSTGGVYSYAQDSGALEQLYHSIQRNLQSEYAISYTSSIPLRDGVNRSLSVSISDSNNTIQPSSTTYNPGGLIPEVGSAAPWWLFGTLSGGLVVLLLIPASIQFFKSISKPKKLKSRVKLLD